MQTFISFASWTDAGLREIKNSPQRLDAAKALAKQFGGELLHVYLTLGDCDLVIVAEFPDDATAGRYLLHIAKLGAVRLRTIKAWPEAEYREMVRGLG